MTKRFVQLLAAVALLAGACGADSSVSTDAGTTDGASTANGDASAGGSETSEGDTPDAMHGSSSDGDHSDHDDAHDSEGPDHEDDEADDDELAVDGGAGGPLGALLFAETLNAGDTGSSARFEGRFTITGAPDSELPGTVELILSGAYDLSTNSTQLTMDMSELFAAASDAGAEEIPLGFESFFAEPIEVVTIGDEGWMRWSFLSMFAGAGDDVWLELDAADVDSATAGVGVSSSVGNPVEILAALAAADATIEDLGTDMVRGVATEHWRALVDLDQLSADATADELAELEEQFGDLGETKFPVDVWIGSDDGYVYRYVLELSSEGFFDAADEVVSSTMSFEFYDYGTDVGITAPPADQVISGDGLLTS